MPFATDVPPRPARPPEFPRRTPPRDPHPWRLLGAGALLAPVLTFTPLLRYMGWFLRSLVHETGHTAMAWIFGCPAIPAIRLDGHAAAVHSAQSRLLCLLAWGGLAAAAWKGPFERGGRLLLVVAAALYPLLAFTKAHEALFLLAGHLGELGFAAFFLRCAVLGGVTGKPAERVANAAAGLYLVGANVWLSGGLLFSDQVKRWYAESGSFGLANDYLRIAREVLHGPLGPVAAVMLLVSLLPLLFALPSGARGSGGTRRRGGAEI